MKARDVTDEPKRPWRPKWRHAAVAALLLLSVAGWIATEFRARRLASEIDALVACAVTIRAVDVVTGEPLPDFGVGLQKSGRFSRERYPTGVIYSLSAAGADPPSIRVRWIAPGPASTVATVRAEGYATDSVRLDAASPDVVTVNLRRAAGAKP